MLPVGVGNNLFYCMCEKGETRVCEFSPSLVMQELAVSLLYKVEFPSQEIKRDLP